MGCSIPSRSPMCSLERSICNRFTLGTVSHEKAWERKPQRALTRRFGKWSRLFCKMGNFTCQLSVRLSGVCLGSCRSPKHSVRAETRNALQDQADQERTNYHFVEMHDFLCVSTTLYCT